MSELNKNDKQLLADLIFDESLCTSAQNYLRVTHMLLVHLKVNEMNSTKAHELRDLLDAYLFEIPNDQIDSLFASARKIYYLVHGVKWKDDK